jgi:hypothetical protein
MQISGFPSPIPDPRTPRVDDRAAAGTAAQAGDARAAARPATAAEAAAVAAPRATPRPTAAVPVEAPPGTDPALWSVLTAEERAFFARAASSGPLTYTKMMGQLNAPAAPALPRGGRMDVRV